MPSQGASPPLGDGADGRIERQARDRRVAWELALFLGAGLFLYVVSVSFDLYGRLIDWARAPHSPALDAWVTLVLILASAFAVFAVRRWYDLSREIGLRSKAEAELRANHEYLHELTTTLRSVTWLATADRTRLLYISPAYETVWGRSIESLHGDPDNLLEGIHEEDRERVQGALRDQTTGRYDLEYRIERPDGSICWVRERAYPVYDDEGAVTRITGIATDITLRKRAEADLANERERLAAIVDTQQALVRTELDRQAVLDHVSERALDLIACDGVSVEVLEGDQLIVRAAHGTLRDEVGTTREPPTSLSGRALETGEVQACLDAREAGDVDRAALERHGARSILVAPLRYGGEDLGALKIVSLQPGPFSDPDQRTFQIMAGFAGAALSHAIAFQNQQSLLGELSSAINRVRRTNAFFRMLQNVAVAGNEAEGPEAVLQTALREVCDYAGWPIGHAYVLDQEHGSLVSSGIWSLDHPRRFQALRRITAEAVIGRGDDLPGQVLASGKALWVEDLRASSAFERGKDAGDLGVVSAFAFPVFAGDRVIAVLEFFHEDEQAHDASILGMTNHIADQISRVYERDLARRALTRYADELARSNKELEEFAYVASHDLQEPLRMVRNYLQLLERRHGERLPEDARDFIGYAVDGAGRMQRLIQDLLLYSRVGTRAHEIVETDVRDALQVAELNLEIALAETGAKITHGDLPVVMADGGQLTQLFQNLIANAVKFRGDDPPRIHIDAERVGPEWVFSVEDNGIGLPPASSERIFVIFQRLHTREDYDGTGIGLAVCKRIVERHGGRIWAESVGPGEGTCFKFALPVRPKLERDGAGELFLARAAKKETHDVRP